MPGNGQYYAVSSRPNALWRHREGGYVVHFDRLVFAGTHMQTFTRLTTMEAANESARHAVNAILDHLVATYKKPIVEEALTPSPSGGLPPIQPLLPLALPGSASKKAEPHNHPTPFGEYCDVWNPEENEFPELELFKEIDAKLVARMTSHVLTDRPPDTPCEPLPHMFDLLRVDEIADWVDTDQQAEAAIHLLASVLQSVVESHTAGGDVLSIVSGLRNRIQSFARSVLPSP
jgi:hypothetical protein